MAKILLSILSLLFSLIASSCSWEVNRSKELADPEHSVPRDFVLVHGAWHGGWAWQPIKERLEKQGHRVWAPHLPGMDPGEHIPPTAKSSIGLEDHVGAVEATLTQHDLSNVVLVGHSYGGMVISGVLGRSAGRVSSAVFLDAIVPENGASLSTYAPKHKDNWHALAHASKNIEPPPVSTWGVRWGLTHKSMLDHSSQLVRSQPPRTFLDPVDWAGPEMTEVGLYYIRCTDNPNPVFENMSNKVRQLPNWNYLELGSHHDVMLLNPQGLVEMLVRISVDD